MKRIILATFALSSLIACRNANSSASVGDKTTATASLPNAPVITFNKEIYDFGKIKAGDKVAHAFKFKNTGKSPLIISAATATCGCTTPQVPKEPVLPGKEGEISVVFNSIGKIGMQDKIITITSNANPNVTKVHLVGEVLEK